MNRVHYFDSLLEKGFACFPVHQCRLRDRKY